MKNFIFDVDGTLIDTREMYVPALQQTLENHGYAPTEDELNHSFGISGDDALKLIGVTDDDLRHTILMNGHSCLLKILIGYLCMQVLKKY